MAEEEQSSPQMVEEFGINLSVTEAAQFADDLNRAADALTVFSTSALNSKSGIKAFNDAMYGIRNALVDINRAVPNLKDISKAVSALNNLPLTIQKANTAAGASLGSFKAMADEFSRLAKASSEFNRNAGVGQPQKTIVVAA